MTMAKHSYSLDAFRVLAIFCVYIAHTGFFNYGIAGDRKLLDGNLLNIGSLAAHFFIVLSAFLAAFFYDRAMQNGYGAYVRKRARRLLPVNIVTLPFYIVVATYIGFYTVSLERTLFDVLSASLLLQELFNFSCKVFNTPAWTISTLFILYLLTPLLMWPLKKVQTPWVLLPLVALLTWADVEYRDWLAVVKPDNWWINYASPVNRILSYMLGLTLGRAARVLTCPPTVRKYATWMELSVFGLFCYGCAVIQFDYASCYAIIMFTTPLVIALCFMESGSISRLVAASGISKASPYVYAFYMVHFLFILLLYAVLKNMLGLWGSLSLTLTAALALAAFAASCAASVLLHHFVEKRFA